MLFFSYVTNCEKASTMNSSMDAITDTECMRRDLLLVWLDEDHNEINIQRHYRTIKDLKAITHKVHIFSDADQCIDFITDYPKHMVLMIVSESFANNTVPILQTIINVSRVYILRKTQNQCNQWSQQYSKVKAIYDDVTSMNPVLKTSVGRFTQDSISISLIPSDSINAPKPINQLDNTFMYTQILKEILLEIDFNEEHVHQFYTYCSTYFNNDSITMQYVKTFQDEYHQQSPIWWYTSQGFLYTMLNKALRDLDTNTIVSSGFFLKDLHTAIIALHREQIAQRIFPQSFAVYRGQSLSKVHLEQMKAAQGGLISFNCFLSTSLKQDVSTLFAESRELNSNLVGIVFKIHIDTTITQTSFARLTNMSAFSDEEEILFAMHPVFRIGEIMPNNSLDEVWDVTLTNTQDTDSQLTVLTDYIRKETESSIGWYRLVWILLKLAQFHSAQSLCEVLLSEADTIEKKSTCYNNIGLSYSSMGEYAKAASSYQKAFDFIEKYLPPNHPDMATSYNNIGLAYFKMGEYSEALINYQKALEIRTKSLPSIHPDIATSYNNIGLVYCHMGEYSKAALNHKKAIEIWQESLPSNHPDIATSYNNIGLAYFKMGQYSEAVTYYQKALTISQESLPPDHPSIATSYNNIGSIYSDMGEYSNALFNYQKAFTIQEKSLPSNHPDIANAYNNIGSVHFKMGQYSEALTYYQKTLNICQNSRPPNHPSMATSYNNIGSIYCDMGEYSNALFNYQKAYEIREKFLPPNHPDIATSYNNIGFIYFKTGQYSETLTYYKKALKILQESLPSNHPSMATSYNNIGVLYSDMGEYSEALLNYQKAHEIWEKSLPRNHPDIATSYNNIGVVYSDMRQYSNALWNYQRALGIQQEYLPANHPDLATSYNNIGLAYSKIGEYSQALLNYEKALEIQEKSLLSNHSSMAIVYNNIGSAYSNMGEYSKALLNYQKAF